MFEAEVKYVADGPFSLPGRPETDAVTHDVYFDSPDGSFTASGRELRLRTVAGRTCVTVKAPPFDAASRSKEEWETAVTDEAVMADILAHCGYVRTVAFSKRCRLSRDVHQGLPLTVTVVTVDFSPFTFVEIEHLATSRQAGLAALPVIRDYAARLGLHRECVTAYTDLFLAAAGAKDRQ